VLAVLASETGAAWERGDLVKAAWQGDFIDSDYLVDVHVANLRRTLRRLGDGRTWIDTVSGTGYRLRA
jgi:DNA-binding response OmpR family regulator